MQIPSRREAETKECLIFAIRSRRSICCTLLRDCEDWTRNLWPEMRWQMKFRVLDGLSAARNLSLATRLIKSSPGLQNRGAVPSSAPERAQCAQPETRRC